MNKPQWKPWHQVLDLREDVKTGDLSLSMFAADLYDVACGVAADIYGKPEDFFATTYPTGNLLRLADDVMKRLAGTGSRTVRQLAQTYGGGKTHAMITLYHLARDPEKLSELDLPTIRQFRNYGGLDDFTQARIAVLPFDKIDLEKGMETYSPIPGEPSRWLRHPWSILAYQIAGIQGLRQIHADGEDAERDSAPAENLLAPLLDVPRAHGLATLILIDEVLMYARGQISNNMELGAQLTLFLQYLTQAAIKTSQCAVVISLLANEPAYNDPRGREIIQKLAEIIQRESEEDVTPVEKADVAQVLRRRFFTPKSLAQDNKEDVLAALVGIKEWDEPTRRDPVAAQRRFADSFPFHPDLTEIFFQKWTNIPTFQRTRGVLRFFALGLRDAAARLDPCPLIGANVFLGPADSPAAALTAATQDLTGVAERATIEGTAVNWTAIVGGELEKARNIQAEIPALKYRELEQAVVATFLHSQPETQKASLRDLLLLISPTRPDKIETRRALKRWAEMSWFLDEREVATAPTLPSGETTLPDSWRLGFVPNLNQLHAQKKKDIIPETVENELRALLESDRKLTSGVNITGAKPSKFPKLPSDLDDDGTFQFAVLGPKAASERSDPSKEALRFLNENTGPDAPRKNKNMVVLAVPSRNKLETVRENISHWKAWQEVRDTVTLSELNETQRRKLQENIDSARLVIPGAIREAYTLAVAYTKKGEPEALLIPDDGISLFSSFKADARLNIQEKPITADTILPDGPYQVWSNEETARSVKHIVDAFAQQPRLPKMLNRQSLLDTIADGCEQGFYALRWRSPDGTLDTVWRDRPRDGVLEAYDKTPQLEAVLPEFATLTRIPAGLLAPGKLPGLWPDPPRLRLGDLRHYFRGGHVVTLPAEGGYTPTLAIPKADPVTVDAAVRAAVLAGHLWLITTSAGFCKEDVPEGLLTADAQLVEPPTRINVHDVLPDALPNAWNGQPETTADALRQALSAQRGDPLPWPLIRQVIDDALRARLLQPTPSSMAWSPAIPATQAASIRLSRVENNVRENTSATTTQPTYTTKPATHAATADLKSDQIMDLADSLSDLMQAAAGCGLTFHLTVELGRDAAPTPEVVQKISDLLTAISPDLSL